MRPRGSGDAAALVDPIGGMSHTHMAAARHAADQLTAQLRAMTVTIDRAHAAGLAVPPAAAAGVERVRLLAVAWAHNGTGHPAPAEVKAALGVG